MKKFFQKIVSKLVKKAVSKSVSDAVSNPEVPVVPDAEPVNDSKKQFWKFILQTLISILTAILTALGATSCMGAIH